MPSTIRPAPSNSAVGKRGIRHKFAPSRRPPPARQNIITLDCVLCLIGSAQAGRALSQSRPSNRVIDIDSTVSLSMHRAFTLTPSGCDRGT